MSHGLPNFEVLLHGLHMKPNLFLEKNTKKYFIVLYSLFAVLQIRRGKRDNLRILFNITPLKLTLYPSLKPLHQDGSNEEAQHMFLLRNKKNYL